MGYYIVATYRSPPKKYGHGAMLKQNPTLFFCYFFVSVEH